MGNMMFDWNQEKIDFFIDASEYTAFHKDLAKVIKPYLNPEWTMCDMGCGLGLIDMHLSDSVSQITAIDLKKDAVRYHKENIRRRKIDNISVECGDVSKISGREWDVLLFSFFSFFDKYDNGIDNLFKLAKRRVIMVTFADEPRERFINTQFIKNISTTSAREKYMIDREYPYEKIVKNMEFGQPVRSLEDARRYFEEYSNEKDPEKRKAQIEKKIHNSVYPVDNEEFPFFISKRKNIGILIVNVENVQEK